jgi:hypothetical protein
LGGKGGAAAIMAMARWTPPGRAGHRWRHQALRFLNGSMLRQDLGARVITIVYMLVALAPDQGPRRHSLSPRENLREHSPETNAEHLATLPNTHLTS